MVRTAVRYLKPWGPFNTGEASSHEPEKAKQLVDAKIAAWLDGAPVQKDAGSAPQQAPAPTPQPEAPPDVQQNPLPQPSGETAAPPAAAQVPEAPPAPRKGRGILRRG